MGKQKTVMINGRAYDAITGLPMVAVAAQPVAHAEPKPAPAARTRANGSHAIHGKTQRSKTLNRAFVQKKVATKPVASAQKPAPAAQPIVAAQKTAPTQTNTATPIAVKIPAPKAPAQTIQSRTARRIDGVRPAPRGSSARANAALAQANAKKRVQLEPIQSTPIVTLNPAANQEVEKAMPHPVVERVHQKHAERKESRVQQAAPTPASVIKQTAIAEALDNAPKHHAKQHKQPKRRGRWLSLVSGFAALVMFAGYLTYLNVPNLSVRVAAAQAGIDASYPGYQPDGYKLNGPVAYSDGEVRMQFAARTGDNDFTLRQTRSSWDSNALLENYVKEKAGNNYATSQEKGITVYNFNQEAAWVSGGILYTIEGSAPLSPEQIRRIATSV